MGLWPDSKKIVVILCFDLDAESLWLARDPSNIDRPVMMSQGEYGPKVGVPRILRLLRKFDIKSTFFVTGWAVERYPEVVDNISSEGHEIAHHGYHHEWLTNLDLDQEKEILEKGITLIEEASGARPLGYRSPSWEFSSHTLKLLNDYGFRYSSNMMNSDLPYKHTVAGGETTLVEIPVQWVLDDAPYFLYSLRLPGRVMFDPSHVYSIWSKEFEAFYREELCFVLTMHPQVIGRPSRIAMLEQLIKYMRGYPDVWFARAIEVANHWIAKALV